MKKKVFSSSVSRLTRSMQYSLQKFRPSSQSPFRSSNPGSSLLKK